MKTLVISKSVESIVKPPPTRSEIMEALVRLKVEQIVNAQKAEVKLREEMIVKAEKLLTSYFKKNAGKMKAEFRLGSEERRWDGGNYIRTGRACGVEARVDMDAVPDDINDLLMRIYGLRSCISIPDERKIRKEIRDGVNGMTGDRVGALLSSPESRSGLEKMLSAIGA